VSVLQNLIIVSLLFLHVYSLAYQVDEIKAYCQAQGYTLLRLFKDESISGEKVDEEALEVDRIGFQEMWE